MMELQMKCCQDSSEIVNNKQHKEMELQTKCLHDLSQIVNNKQHKWWSYKRKAFSVTISLLIWAVHFSTPAYDRYRFTAVIHYSRIQPLPMNICVLRHQ